MSGEPNGKSVLVSVSVQYEHFRTILFKPFLSISVSGNVNTELLPAATKLGQGNIFTGVCLSTGVGRGVCLSACWDTHPPPPRSRPPLDQAPPQDQALPPLRRPPRTDTPPGSRLQHTVYERPVRILLECILVVREISV